MAASRSARAVEQMLSQQRLPRLRVAERLPARARLIPPPSAREASNACRKRRNPNRSRHPERRVPERAVEGTHRSDGFGSFLFGHADGHRHARTNRIASLGHQRDGCHERQHRQAHTHPKQGRQPAIEATALPVGPESGSVPPAKHRALTLLRTRPNPADSCLTVNPGRTGGPCRGCPPSGSGVRRCLRTALPVVGADPLRPPGPDTAA